MHIDIALERIGEDWVASAARLRNVEGVGLSQTSAIRACCVSALHAIADKLACADFGALEDVGCETPITYTIVS